MFTVFWKAGFKKGSIMTCKSEGVLSRFLILWAFMALSVEVPWLPLLPRNPPKGPSAQAVDAWVSKSPSK